MKMWGREVLELEKSDRCKLNKYDIVKRMDTLKDHLSKDEKDTQL
jgi:hypothetical protein